MWKRLKATNTIIWLYCIFSTWQISSNMINTLAVTHPSAFRLDTCVSLQHRYAASYLVPRFNTDNNRRPNNVLSFNLSMDSCTEHPTTSITRTASVTSISKMIDNIYNSLYCIYLGSDVYGKCCSKDICYATLSCKQQQ